MRQGNSQHALTGRLAAVALDTASPEKIMSRYLCITGSITALLLLTSSNSLLHAQVSQTQSTQQSAVLADIQKSVIRTIGAQENTVEVAVTGNILIITRVNSNMNNATHGGRDNEATAIAGVVSKAMVGKPEFNSIISLRVQYLAREAGDKTGKAIDTIEFRADLSGKFQFHKT